MFFDLGREAVNMVFVRALVPGLSKVSVGVDFRADLAVTLKAREYTMGYVSTAYSQDYVQLKPSHRNEPLISNL